MEYWKNKSPEDLPGEKWENIPTYNGIYQGSTLGRIRIAEKILKSGEFRPAKIRSQSVGTNGYLIVSLTKEKKSKTCTVHRLIAMTFIPNPRDCKYVNHKKGNRLDNRVTELEWNTKSEDERHSIDVLGKVAWMKGRKGKDCPTSKPVNQFDLKGNFVASFINGREAAKAVNISYKCISSCINGRQKTAAGFIWKAKKT